MNVFELSLSADAEGAEAVAGVLNEYAYGGAVIEQTVTPEPGQRIDTARPYTVRAFFLADETSVEKRRSMEDAIWHLSQLRPFGEVQVRELEEKDWAEAWKKFYSILHVGDRIVIKPSWLEYSPLAGEIVIQLDPGMAFGTGLHPTTRLCLAALEKYTVPGSRVLDVGTGSGILAIAAAKLGANIVDARDLDPIAVETTLENIDRNWVGGTVTVKRGSVTATGESNKFDLITINIFAETIIDLAPLLTSSLVDKGRVIASGILAEKASAVTAALERQGITSIETMAEEDWVALVGEKGTRSD